jgi:hypothetical protein
VEVVNASLRTLGRVRDLCLFRAGPQDLPYSPRAVIALLIVGAVLAAIFDLSNGTPVATVIGANAGTLIALAALRTMLRWRGKPERFVQTALALIATGLLFELILLPLAWLTGLPAMLAAQPKVLGSSDLLVLLSVSVLVVWQAGISAQILRKALEIPFAGGVLVLLLIGFADLFGGALVAAMLGAK